MGNPNIDSVKAALDNLAIQLETYSVNIQDLPLCNIYGYHHPAVSKSEIVSSIKELSAKLGNNIEAEYFEEGVNAKLSAIPVKIQAIITHVLPNMFNGSGAQALPAYFETMKWIEDVINELYSWQPNKATNYTPKSVTARLKYITSQLEAILNQKSTIDKKIQTISQAYDVVESQVGEINAFIESSKEVNVLKEQASKVVDDLIKIQESADAEIRKIGELKTVGDEIIAKCHKALAASTTIGLASSFSKRAQSLTQSVWGWVVILFISLAAGGFVGYYRFSTFSKLIQTNKIDTGPLVMEFIICVLSLSAAVWFSWIATKQITQRFRLSEEYSFKAAVAMAYEGYRAEATRLDPALEKRLFESALDRLDEKPLRVMEIATHGSPFHEFWDSAGAKEFLAKIINSRKTKNSKPGEETEPVNQ